MIKLADALHGVIRLGFDTAPLIYLVERHPDYIHTVREFFRLVDVGSIEGFTGMISFAEVLVVPKRMNNKALEDAYYEVLFNSLNFSVLPIGAEIADRAADLRSWYKLKLPDALQVAAALEAGCEAFLTNDEALHSITDLSVIVLKDVEL
ncbi:MAG: type II toxin-antitoxin system VapC family toxin [Janthinobacterium lividum]